LRGNRDNPGKNVVVFKCHNDSMELRLYVGRGKVPLNDVIAEENGLHGWGGGAGDPAFMVHRQIAFNSPIPASIAEGIEYARQVGNWAQLPQ
jgi:hypothetical protein